MICFGFDTSNYTTSFAIFDGKIFNSERRILEVKEGERGLRQSDALFQHIKYMPYVMSKISVDEVPKCIGVSTRPRSVEGSYMPVFLAGRLSAESSAKATGAKLFEFSHQDGHIMAGIESCKAFELLEETFLSVHLSGGTTEILKTKYNGYNFDCEIVGGTKDISAGQVIDRVGVGLGLKFPSGKELDELSKKANTEIKFPISVCGGYFNFSGLEAKAMQSKDTPQNIAKGVFVAVSSTLSKSLLHLQRELKVNKILIVGGVASNSYIRENLTNCFRENIYFASPALSTDNACGIASLAYRAYKQK